MTVIVAVERVVTVVMLLIQTTLLMILLNMVKSMPKRLIISCTIMMTMKDMDGAANEVDDLNNHPSDQFSINKRVSYFMNRAAITANTCVAVEYVYMIKAEKLTRGSVTRGLDDVKKLLHSKYVSLIRQIPSGQSGEFGLREKMIEKYYGAKTGGPSGLYTQVLDVKKSAGSYSFD